MYCFPFACIELLPSAMLNSKWQAFFPALLVYLYTVLPTVCVESFPTKIEMRVLTVTVHIYRADSPETE